MAHGTYFSDHRGTPTAEYTYMGHIPKFRCRDSNPGCMYPNQLDYIGPISYNIWAESISPGADLNVMRGPDIQPMLSVL